MTNQCGYSAFSINVKPEIRFEKWLSYKSVAYVFTLKRHKNLFLNNLFCNFLLHTHVHPII
ncbi:MAG: hypothetical protein JWM14_224 [Chitinophagaceae bacterium]|nr:hypothetical protein [Chitinophagaceae bacterium]